MQTLPTNHLVLEIAPDRAGLLEALDVGGAFLGIGRISAFEVDRQRQVDRIGNSPRIVEHEIERHLLGVPEAGRIADRMAARRERFRPRRGDRTRAADIPDVVENDGIAGNVEFREILELAHDGFCLL